MAPYMGVRAERKLKKYKREKKILGKKKDIRSAVAAKYGPSLRNVASSERVRGSELKLKYKKF